MSVGCRARQVIIHLLKIVRKSSNGQEVPSVPQVPKPFPSSHTGWRRLVRGNQEVSDAGLGSRQEVWMEVGLRWAAGNASQVALSGPGYRRKQRGTEI